MIVLRNLRTEFACQKHKELFEIEDLESGIEIVQWKARVICKISKTKLISNKNKDKKLKDKIKKRNVYFKNKGLVKTNIFKYKNLKMNRQYIGPAVIETQFKSVLIEPEVKFKLNQQNCLELKIPEQKRDIRFDESSTYLW